MLLCQTASWHRHRETWAVLLFASCLLIAPLVIEPQGVKNKKLPSAIKSEDSSSLRQLRPWSNLHNNIADDTDAYTRDEARPEEHNVDTVPTIPTTATSFASSTFSIGSGPTSEHNLVRNEPASTPTTTIRPTDASMLTEPALATNGNVISTRTLSDDTNVSPIHDSSSGPSTLSSSLPSTIPSDNPSSDPSLIPSGTQSLIPTTAPNSVPSDDSSVSPSRYQSLGQSGITLSLSAIIPSDGPSTTAELITNKPTSNSPSVDVITLNPSTVTKISSSSTNAMPSTTTPVLTSPRSTTQSPTSSSPTTPIPTTSTPTTPTPTTPTPTTPVPTTFSPTTSVPTSPTPTTPVPTTPTPTTPIPTTPQPSTVAPTTSEPTILPTYAPTESAHPSSFVCRNDENYRYNGEKKKSCNWVMFKNIRQNKLCERKDVASACPISCGICCADNLEFTFIANSGRQQDCSWIAEKLWKRQDKYCINRSIRHQCYSTCDNCVVLTPRPTPSPTSTLSSSPTLIESKNPSQVPTGSPSLSHTTYPSNEPSQSPSNNPTIRPTDSPTTKPSMRPTGSPTMKPTGSPTMKPTESPTAKPSLIPTESPTTKPSISPIESPTTKPSTNPTLRPTMKHTLPSHCADLIYTQFGTTNKGDVKVIQFDYEIEHNPLIPGSLLWDILPSVESTLTNLLIQDLLPMCKDNNLLSAVNNAKSKKVDELIGISSQPIDVSDGDSDCQSEIATGSVCAPIRGGVSLYLQSASNGIEYAAQTTIKKLMDDDQLLSAHDGVLKVTYMSKVKFLAYGDEEGITLDADYETSFWSSGYFRGILFGVVSGCATIFLIRYAMTREKNKCLSHCSTSEWTEVEPDSGYNNSSDGTVSSDDETIITSNKVGSIIRAIKKEEMVVDVDIESCSTVLKEKETFAKKESCFDVIFEETEEKKKHIPCDSKEGDSKEGDSKEVLS